MLSFTKRNAMGWLMAAVLLFGAPLARAADMPQKPQTQPRSVSVVAAPINWTGFYPGLQLGYALKDHSVSTAALFGFSASAGGDDQALSYGVELLALYQPPGTRYVLGAGIDWNKANLSSASPITISGPCGGCPFNIGRYTHELQNYGAGYLLAGYSFDRWLAYLTVGVAHGRGEAEAVVGGTSSKAKANHLGYRVGGGARYAMAANLVAKLEYVYSKYGPADYAHPAFGPGAIVGKGEFDTHEIRTGLSYHF